MTRRGWIALAAAAVLAAAFAYANRYERLTVDFGTFSVYAIPLPLFFFAAFLLGMAAMLLLSLPHDRKTRDLLRAHGLLGDGPVSVPPPSARPLFEREPSPSFADEPPAAEPGTPPPLADRAPAEP